MSYRSRGSLSGSDTVWAYIMLAPTLLITFVFFYLAIGASLLISFTDWSSLSAPNWLGLKNYRFFFSDPKMFRSLWNTLRFTIMYVPSVILAGLALALMLDSGIRGRNVYRLLFFLPRLTLPVAVALLWKWLYNYRYGLLNYIVKALGGESINWLGNPAMAMPSIVIMSVWIGAGYAMLIFLAGLQNIPAMYYEAATIDGATALQKLFTITVPLISPTAFFLTVTTTIYSFQVFDQVFVMTNGGPVGSTRTLMFAVYEEGFRFYRLGSAASIAWVLFVLIFLVTAVQFKAQKRWVHYT